MDSFNAKKARTFLQKQVHHISTNRELADGIKFLFDEHGRPPNMPIEDIVEERRMVEYHLMWVEGVLNELRHRLIKIKEVGTTPSRCWRGRRKRTNDRGPDAKQPGTRVGILAAAIACATTLSACAGLGPDYTR